MRVYIVPQNASVPATKTISLHAHKVSFRDPTRTDQGANLTGAWSSSQPTVATVDSTGIVTGVNVGTTLITLQSGPYRAFAAISVTPQLLSIAVTPANSSIPRGTSQQMTAMAHYSSGPDQDVTNQMLWSSINASCATIGPV